MPLNELLRDQLAAWKSVGLSGGGTICTPSISPHDPDLIFINCDMSCGFRSTDGGRTWSMIHYHHLQGSTECPAAFHPSDPNVVFGVHGWRSELRVSRDQGQTWTALSKDLPKTVRRIAVDPGNADLMLAGLADGVSYSTDGGATWQGGEGVSGPVVGLHVDQTSPKEKRRCFAASSDGVFASEDGGAIWERVWEGLPGQELRDFAGGSNADASVCALYCAVGSDIVDGEFIGGVYRSTDGGRTWQQAMGAGIDLEARDVEVEDWGVTRVPQYVLVATNNVSPMTVYATQRWPGQVYRSDDGGDSWRPRLYTEIDSPKRNLEPNYLMAERGRSSSNLCGLTVDPMNPERVITTDWMCAQITDDGGKTWKTMHTRRAEGQGDLAKGQAWENVGLVVTTVWHYYIDPFEKHRHYMAYTDIHFARSLDHGETWICDLDKPTRNTTYQMAFDPDTPGKIWAAFADLHDIPNDNVISGRHYRPDVSGGVGFTEDFAETWRDASQGLPPKSMTSIVLDPRSPKGARVLYVAAFEGGVFKSVDDGKTWVDKSKGLGAPGKNVRACRLILHDDGTLFCLITALQDSGEFFPEGPGLYRSNDGGDNWECINTSQPLLWPKDYDVDPRDSKIIYLGADDAMGREEAGLYKTTDGGQTWRRVARKGPNTFGATVHPTRPGWVYLNICENMDQPGLWLSKDAGETWEPFWGIPFSMIQRVSFDPDDDSIIYVCTFGGSLWKGPPEPQPVR